MKRITISIIVLNLLISIGYSQVELGLSTGLNISNVQVSGVSPNFVPERNFITSFRPGITLSLPLDERFSFYTGIATEQRGFDVFIGTDLDFVGISFPLGATAKTRISYVEVPINFRLDFLTDSGKLRPWLAAGANLGYAYQGSVATAITVILDFQVSERALNLNNDSVRRFDIAPNITAGLDIPYKRGFFTFALGYEHSVQNFFNDTSIGIETRHYGFTPSFGYSYALGNLSKA